MEQFAVVDLKAWEEKYETIDSLECTVVGLESEVEELAQLLDEKTTMLKQCTLDYLTYVFESLHWQYSKEDTAKAKQRSAGEVIEMATRYERDKSPIFKQPYITESLICDAFVAAIQKFASQGESDAK